MQMRPVADKASLSDLRRSIRADLMRAGICDADVFDCLIAVTEACNQALGEIPARGDEPEIRWEIDDLAIRFFVEGHCSRASAKASHPSGGPSATRDFEPVDPEFGATGITGFMDEVSVQAGPRGRTIALTKHLRG